MIKKKAKRKLTKKAIRCIASAVCVLGVLAVCFGVAGYQNKVQAENDQIVTRGVIDNIDQIPKTKRDMYENNTEDTKETLGTKENPFLILEVVPYKEYALFGYHISGCEPIDMSQAFGRTKDVMGLIGSLKSGIAVQQDEAYFFSEEPECDPDKYDEPTGIPTKKVDGQPKNGYYECVTDGSGYFEQQEDGTITKKSHGNIIWHTMCKTEQEQDKQDFISSEAAKDVKLKNVGDRVYTVRMNTEEDPAYRSNKGYFYYKNNDDFLKNSLELLDEEAKNYSVVIKTITPEELNANPEWVNYADLCVLSRKEYYGMSTVWGKYNRFGEKTTSGTHVDSFEGKHDISWPVAYQLFERVTADKNFMGLVMGSSLYKVGTYTNTKGSTDLDVYDWNYQKTGTIPSQQRCNSNVYKLMLMLYSMDHDIFKQLYLTSDNPLGKPLIDKETGDFLLREGDDRQYWSMYTFLMMGPSDITNPYDYFTKQKGLWENYGILGNLEVYESWINGHLFSFNDNNALSFDYNAAAEVPNSKFNDYQIYLNEYYNVTDGTNHGGTPSDAVRYILGDRSKNHDTEITGTLNILDIEPCYDSKNGYTLQESYIRMMIPKFTGTVHIKHMTTAEFIGSAEDLNSTYDMIFMGLDDGAYKIDSNTKLPDWYDWQMDGKIYFHTGDRMTQGYHQTPKYENGGLVWNDRERNVDFLGIAKTGDKQQEWMRFPGNDLTKIKCEELKNYLKAGYPIVAVPYLYNTDEKRIDQNSNICTFIKKNKNAVNGNSPLYSAGDTSHILEVFKKKKPEITFTKLPNIYNGDSDEDGKIISPNYLEQDSAKRHLIPFTFTVSDPDNHQYGCNLYLDQNQDGKFETDELFMEGKTFYANEGEQKLICKLSQLYFGLIQWKLEVYQTDNPQIRFVETGCSAASNQSGAKQKIRVLQIMPKDGTYDGKLDLATSEIFKKYYSKLKDYDIQVTTTTVADYEKNFTEGTKFEYDFSKDIKDDGADKNPKNLAASQQNLIKNYDMIIIGFGDSYGGVNISNQYGAVDFLKYYVAKGHSILFTHDLTSMYNTESDVFGYSANTLLRDLLGMNRYRAVNQTMSEEDKKELTAYQEKNSGKYDTVTKATSTYTEKANSIKLDQTHGFTYYAMKRLGWSWNDACGKGKMPYQYLITNPDGKPICSDTNKSISGYTTVYEEKSGFNNNNDITTQATQTNEGQITQYPYKIGSTLSIAKTHGQWFQLNMEDPEVTVWYSLADDGVHAQWPDTYTDDDERKATELDKNGYDRGDKPFMDQNKPGTASTYGVSPNDAANNYYIYSKGNVFYSGVGHSEVTGDQEAQLFVNTMIAAYRATYDSPMVEVLNPEAELTSAVDANPLTYHVSIAQEYNGDTVEDLSAQKKMIEFCPVETNIMSSKLDCAIFYYDPDNGNVKEYVSKIYYKDSSGTMQEITPTKTDEEGHPMFEYLKNMKSYYFEYPYDYLNGTNGKDIQRNIKFKITNNKKNGDEDVKPGYTTLDMSVQALFQLD